MINKAYSMYVVFIKYTLENEKYKSLPSWQVCVKARMRNMQYEICKYEIWYGLEKVEKYQSGIFFNIKLINCQHYLKLDFS